MDSSNDICRREFWSDVNVGWYARLMEDMRRDFEENAVGVFDGLPVYNVSTPTSGEIKEYKKEDQ